MKKYSIGLYLNIKPEIGGSYQYTLSIITALTNLQENGYEIVCYFHDPDWNSILPETFLRKVCQRSLIRKILSVAYKKVDRSLNSYRRFSALFHPETTMMNRDSCDLIIFPGQDHQSYLVNKPSIVPIHDLMHRYESHYVEYKKVKKARDHHYQNICKFASGILVDSGTGRNQVLESYAVDPEKIFVLPFIPPHYLGQTKFVDIRTKYGLADEYIFYPAQFWEHKNHRTLLHAVYLLKKMGAPVQLVLVGSKYQFYSSVIRMISEYALENEVKILGYVSNDEMYSLYKEAMALTFVSMIGPTNIPPLEAMWVGCPVIVSNKYAMPEQVGDAGLVIDPLDPQDIAEKILMIRNDRALRTELIRKGHEQSARWGQEEFASRLEEIMLSVLSKDIENNKILTDRSSG